MKFKFATTALAILAAAGLWTSAQAQTAGAATSPAAGTSTGVTGATASGMQMPDMSDGEVRKIDKENKKITLKHGEIKNLGMPGMTMVFQVKDPAVLDTLKQGDKVMFKAEKANGALVVTEIQSAK
ncbi:copper-binding protein [Piscinibacter terrae]|uniref:Copper-binding protein n=1 Tax=Piscinibacter terrae TaxID=2496871 RepID=A0A3N7HIC1_9BURK|nr:copper-binding protein [Albitalea terrae]RQP21797.1 copper-binding protein [Albitalea terrae]